VENAGPVDLYLSQLRGPAATRAQVALVRLAGLLSGGATPASALPWHDLAPEVAATLRLWAVLSHPPAAAKALLAPLRGVLRWAARAGQLEADEAASVLRALGRVRGASPTSLRVGHPVARRSIEALIGVCDREDGALATRDAALLAVMTGGGLGAAAAARLDWRDFDGERGLLLLRTKGRAGRAVVIGETTVARRLAAWASVSGRRDGPIFVSLAAAGRALSPAGIAAVVRRRAGQAGVGRLGAADLAASYRWELGRLGGRDPLRPPCSLLSLDDGTVWLATPCFDPQAAQPDGRSRRAG
jgi:integrase